jgi:hypothetical protein
MISEPESIILSRRQKGAGQEMVPREHWLWWDDTDVSERGVYGHIVHPRVIAMWITDRAYMLLFLVGARL